MAKRGIARTASPLAFALALALAPVPSRADAVAPTLPFTPPAGFTQLPTGILPKDPTSWTHGPAVFSISRMPDGIRLPFADVANSIRHQVESLGSTTTSKTLTVCGKPAMRMTAIDHDTSFSTTEQIQMLGPATYVLSYVHPTAIGTDDRISHVLGTFCGLNGATPPVPPAGWKESETRLLGLWLAPEQQTMTVLQTAPEPDVAAKARTMMNATVKTRKLVMLSETEGTLCGLPSITIRAKATPGTTTPTDITFEFTQSKTQAFSLIYTHSDAQPVNAEALASLATLCAARTVAPAAAPPPATAPPIPDAETPASTPTASATPAPGETTSPGTISASPAVGPSPPASSSSSTGAPPAAPPAPSP